MSFKRAPLGIVLAIIALLVFFYFGLSRPGSIYAQGVDHTEAKLIRETDAYATYSFSFTSQGVSQRSDCNEHGPEGFDFTVASQPFSQSALPLLAPNLDQTSGVEAAEVSLSGVSGIHRICSSVETNTDIVLDEAKAFCSIQPYGISQAQVSCRFAGQMHAEIDGAQTSAKYYGPSGGSAVVTFPKKGLLQPLSDTSSPGVTSSITPGSSSSSSGSPASADSSASSAAASASEAAPKPLITPLIKTNWMDATINFFINLINGIAGWFR